MANAAFEKDFFFPDEDYAKGFREGVETIAEELVDYHLTASCTRPRVWHDEFKDRLYKVTVTLEEAP